ncbi:uncharacterized protein [Penaeus vannamei]|uniref:uncharacterized protein n=1 Tax=Penaeus vannamei TaxID=6689 RepID=UPI00387F664E
MQGMLIPVPDRPISRDPSIQLEVREAISKLKGGKAACISDIPAKLLKVEVECHHEFGHGLLPGMLSWQYNSVHHELLMKILKLWGIPTWIIGLIASLYTGTESAVGGLSRFFPVDSGVKRGCVFAPTLFNTYKAWTVGRATFQCQCGATLGNIKVTVLYLVDNVAVLPESLAYRSPELRPRSRILGEPVQSIRVCFEDVEVTESFTYLGSAVLHVSGLSDQEASRRIGLAADQVLGCASTYAEGLSYVPLRP